MTAVKVNARATPAGAAAEVGNDVIPRIPVRVVARPRMVEEHRQALAEYERQHGMSSAAMAALVDEDEIIPTIEVIEWYQTYDELQFLIATPPTTGTRGTTTGMFTSAGRARFRGQFPGHAGVHDSRRHGADQSARLCRLPLWCSVTGYEKACNPL